MGNDHFFLRDGATFGLTMQAGENKTRTGRNTRPGRLSVKIPAATRRCVPAMPKGATIWGARARDDTRAASAQLHVALAGQPEHRLAGHPREHFGLPARCRQVVKTGMPPRSTGTNSKV